jgi:predicted CopG family antitoxin
MSKELKTIHVSEEVWRRLVELKLNLKMRSVDDVIRFLLERASLRSSEEIRRRILMWEDIMEKVYAALHSEKEDVSYLRNLLVLLGHIEDEVDILIDDPELAAAIIKELKWVLGEEKGGGDG